MRTRSGALLLAAALYLVGCGADGSGVGTSGGEVDSAALEAAADAQDLPAALEVGERIVTDLVAAIDVAERDRDEVRPHRVSLCDEVADDAPSLVSVARGIGFASEDTGDVLDRIRTALDAAGVDGVAVVGEDSDVPMVTGVFAGDTWQVAATLNRPDGIGEVRVNSACLPGELPDAP